MFKPSKEQQAFFDFVSEGTGNALINAVAGSGKSTTIIQSLNLIPKNQKVLFLAFNKSIVDELSSKVPSHVEVKTLHSLGWRAILDAFPRTKLDKFGKKIKDLIDVSSIKWDTNDFAFKNRVKKLVSLGKLSYCQTLAEMVILAGDHNVEIEADEPARALEIIEKANEITSLWDFDDMIYQPIKRNLALPKYDWVFVDECQDLSVVQQQLFQKTLHSESRFVAVGDPYQSIYYFMGANSEAFNNLKKFPNTQIFPLSTTFRCSKEVVKMAQTLVPHINHREGAADGKFDFQASVNDIREGDMVICRNTAPLVQLCMSFLKQRIKANVKGVDVETSLKKWITKYKESSISDFINKDMPKELAYARQNFLKMVPNGNPENAPSVQKLNETLEIFTVMVEESEDILTISDLDYLIDKIFKSSEGITLSTIHRVKGLEADRVFLIDRNLIPSKYAKTEEQLNQENNLLYVAYTRAKSYFGIVEDWHYRGSKAEIVNPERENVVVRKVVSTEKEGDFVPYTNQPLKKGMFVVLENGESGIITRYSSNKDMSLMNRTKQVNFEKTEVKQIESQLV